MWTWIVIAFGVLVGVPVMLAILGLLLPQGHRASRSAVFRRPPAEVWQIVTDFASAPTWRKGVQKLERGDDLNGHPVWIEYGLSGKLTYEVAHFDPPKRMITRIVDDKLPFGGTWTYELTPVAEGTRLTLTENGEIYNPMFRFLARFVFGYTSTMETYLHSLAKRFGESIECS